MERQTYKKRRKVCDGKVQSILYKVKKLKKAVVAMA